MSEGFFFIHLTIWNKLKSNIYIFMLSISYDKRKSWDLFLLQHVWIENKPPKLLIRVLVHLIYKDLWYFKGNYEIELLWIFKYINKKCY